MILDGVVYYVDLNQSETEYYENIINDLLEQLEKVTAERDKLVQSIDADRTETQLKIEELERSIDELNQVTSFTFRYCQDISYR
jgi:ferritin-like metal-binding protein YciE